MVHDTSIMPPSYKLKTKEAYLLSGSVICNLASHREDVCGVLFQMIGLFPSPSGDKIEYG